MTQPTTRIAIRQIAVVLDTDTTAILRARGLWAPVLRRGRLGLGVQSGKLPYDLPFPERAVDVRAHRFEVSLGLGRCHAPMRHEPAQGDRGAAPAAGFAMNVDRLAPASMGFDEVDGSLDIAQGRRREIERRRVQLFDAVPSVSLFRPPVFDAGVDDGPDTSRRHVIDQPGERQRAQQHVGVDLIPPAPVWQQPRQDQVVEQGRDEQEADHELPHVGTVANADGRRNLDHDAALPGDQRRVRGDDRLDCGQRVPVEASALVRGVEAA